MSKLFLMMFFATALTSSMCAMEQLGQVYMQYLESIEALVEHANIIMMNAQRNRSQRYTVGNPSQNLRGTLYQRSNFSGKRTFIKRARERVWRVRQ